MATIQRAGLQRGDLALWDGLTKTASRIDATGGTITGLTVGDFVDVLQVYGSGTDRIGATIATATARIASANVALLFATGTWEITSSLSIPSNFTCIIPAGCVFNIASGQTLTLLGTVFTESASWYSGSGTVVANSVIGPNRTAAEIAAGVTPTNYAYEPGNVLRYGALGDDSTDSTTAFNNAIASNERVYVPVGTYRLTALDAIDDRCVIYGDGATSILKFNTTGVGLSFDISPGLGNPQGESFTVRDLAFTNVTNTPAAFIQNGATSNGTVNGLIERCYFSSCAATYCIDAFIGYGLKIRNCVFATVTGSAIRLQDSLNQATGYSFVASIDGCDITSPSLHGIVIEGAQVLGISNTVIEDCGGKGVYVLALTNTVQAWNIHLDNVYFEANTGTDIDLADVDGTYVAQMLLTSCQFTGSPTIALGTHSQITIQNCWNSGGSSCTVSGSSSAGAILINSINFTKSGTFRWVELGLLNSTQNTTDAIAFTPSWGADSVNPAIGDGTIVGYYTRLGKNVHVEVEVNMGSTTTFGTGDWFFGNMPFTCDANIGSTGAGQLYDNNLNNNYPAAANIFKNTAIVRVWSVGTTGGGVDSAQPFTWAQSDILRFSIDYIAA